MADAVELDQLPIEILEEIFKNIDGLSLGKCRRVSKKWKELIDDNDLLWQGICLKELTICSQIAKKHCGHECSWYHLYKNLQKWTDFKSYEKNLKVFQTFTTRDKFHALDFSYGVLPIKDGSDTVLYDMHLKRIPINFQGQNCLKLHSNALVSVLQINDKILVQRSVECPTYDVEATFEAIGILLTDDILYFHNKTDVFKCNLHKQKLAADCIAHSHLDPQEFYHSYKILFLLCFKIAAIRDLEARKNSRISAAERGRKVQKILAGEIRDHLVQVNPWSIIEVDIYMRYIKGRSERPTVTAVFYYGNFLLYANKAGAILLDHVDRNRFDRGIKLTDKVAQLPEGKIAVKLDVCERPTGPIIIAATERELYTIEINFFPHEQKIISPARLVLEERLKLLEERVKQLKA